MTAPPRSSVLCLGEPGTGKSSGLIQQNADPQHVGPILCRSTRYDNRIQVSATLRAAGKQVLVLDISGQAILAGGEQLYRVSLIDGCDTWPAALERAQRLVQSGRETGVSMTGTDIVFEAYASDVVAALLLAACTARRAGVAVDTADIARWVAGLSTGADALAEPAQLLAEHAGVDASIAIGALVGVTDGRDNNGDTIAKIRSSVGSPLLAGAPLRHFIDTDRLGATDPDRVLADGATVFIEVSDDNHVRARAHAALSGLVEDVLIEAQRRRWRSHVGVEPLRVLYDESATGAINPNLTTWAATGAGDGIALMLCAQSLHQLERVFPKEGAGLLDCFTHRIFLRGHSIDGERIAKMFGDYDHVSVETSWSSAWSGSGTHRRTHNTSRHRRPRVTAEDLVRMPQWYGLLATADYTGPIRLQPHHAGR